MTGKQGQEWKIITVYLSVESKKPGWYKYTTLGY